MVWMNLHTKQKETHRLRKWTCGCQGEGLVRDFGKVMYIQLYLKWITNKDVLSSTWDFAQLFASLDERGSQGRMGMYSWVPSCSPETITALLIGCIPIQNKILKFEGKKKAIRDKEGCYVMIKLSILQKTWQFFFSYFLKPWNF